MIESCEANFGRFGSIDFGERLITALDLADDTDQLTYEEQNNKQAAANGDEVELAGFLLFHIKEHDDEDEEYHNCACVDEDLNDADEEGAELNEKPSEADEGKEEAKSARYWVAVEHHTEPGSEHDSGEDVEEQMFHLSRKYRV